jgi:Flp pilus assembly protein TadD
LAGIVLESRQKLKPEAVIAVGFTECLPAHCYFRYNLLMQSNEAFKLFQQGKLEQAKQLCIDLIRAQPGEKGPLMLMSAILHRMGNQAQAVNCLLQVAGMQTGDVAAQLKLVTTLRNMGALREAGELLDRLDGNLPEVALGKAQVAWQNGHQQKALAAFEAAAKKWPGQPELINALIRALLRLGELDRAGEVLVDAQARWPGDPELSRLKAVMHLDRSEPDLAFEELSRTADQANRESMAHRMFQGLQVLRSGNNDGLLKPHDAIGRSFAWASSQPGHVAWFGTNSGLLHWAVEQTGEQLPAGSLIVECGVYHGFSIKLMSKWSQREIHGFDSFEGLPEQWKAGEPAGSYSTQGQLPSIANHVHLHPGWFEDTLSGFAENLEIPIALLHIDCDLYSSTRTVLAELGPKLVPGSLVVFDDFLAYEGYEEHEFRAAQEYFESALLSFELAGAVLLGRSVAYRVAL